MPGALPLLPDDHGGHDPAALPGIQTIAVTIERGLVGLVLLLHLPFAAEVRHPDRGAGWSCLLSRRTWKRDGNFQRRNLSTEGLTPRSQDPFAESVLEHACLTQRKHHLATLWTGPDIADVVEFHPDPSDLAARPYLQRDGRDRAQRHRP